jgi:hypothetical protein
MSAQIVSANDLRDGSVVYLGPDSRWTAVITQAAVANDDDAAKKLLAVAEYHATTALVVAPYLIDVQTTADSVVPVLLRERLRATGPSIL